jgi:CheY-like chemotaxis protein
MARLLLVDDEHETLAWMTAALEAAGHEVRAVDSGRRGLDELHGWTPDLIVADILMPEMDGLTFARLAKRFGHVPLLFVSIAERQAEAVLLGAAGYVAKPATAAEVRAAVEQVLGRPAGPRTILVVDDDPDVCELYRICLEQRFRVLTAEQGQDALEILDQEPVDLLITDVHMPVMNGVELIRAVRRRPRLRDLPIIVQTSDRQAAQAPVWVELHVAQASKKGDFLRWMNARIEHHLEER